MIVSVELSLELGSAGLLLFEFSGLLVFVAVLFGIELVVLRNPVSGSLLRSRATCPAPPAFEAWPVVCGDYRTASKALSKQLVEYKKYVYHLSGGTSLQGRVCFSGSIAFFRS